jgi:hypothetical protein
MFGFILNRKKSVPRPSLYCVWIRAHQGENAPLIRVWIDPEMSMFDSQARVHEPDLAAAIAEEEAALARGTLPREKQKLWTSLPACFYLLFILVADRAML